MLLKVPENEEYLAIHVHLEWANYYLHINNYYRFFEHITIVFASKLRYTDTLVRLAEVLNKLYKR